MTASDQVSSDKLTALLSSASVEVSSRGHQLQELRDNFRPGTDVTITFLPGDNYRHNLETASALRSAGFNPVPHIAARELPSREALDDFLARARGEAEVTRILLIAGDVLAAWQEWGRRTGIDVNIVTQFCFESAPILRWIGELNARGIDLPVIVGLAGPATPATLTKFALRCGIGNSMRALRGQIGRFGRLLIDTGPDDVVRGLQSAPPAATASIAGFHLFPFGGLRKSADWLRNYDGDQL